MNLQEAARQVGVSKKSLDDYYCQFRLAEQHCFDFQGNWHQKMGVLRTFVKTHRNEESIRIPRHFKHPRQLGILDLDLDALVSGIERQIHQAPTITVGEPKNDQEKAAQSKAVFIIKKEDSLQDMNPSSMRRMEGDELSGGLRTPIIVPSVNDNASFFGDNESSNHSYKMFFDLENGFFDNFQAQINEPQDPFLKMGKRFSEPDSDNPFNGIW